MVLLMAAVSGVFPSPVAPDVLTSKLAAAAEITAGGAAAWSAFKVRAAPVMPAPASRKKSLRTLDLVGISSPQENTRHMGSRNQRITRRHHPAERGDANIPGNERGRAISRGPATASPPRRPIRRSVARSG